MIEVVQICRYPLTGARAETLEHADILASGLRGDRKLLLYQAASEDEPAKRASQLEFPSLSCVQARTAEDSTEIYIPNYGNFYIQDTDDPTELTINEFGDQVPAVDAGDAFARRFQKYLGKENLRLAQKSAAWMLGGLTHPQERVNRPLHIVSMASVRELQQRMPLANFGAERFRPNIVIDGDLEPFEENQWLEHPVVINGIAYQITQLTQRCPVPGYDQRTGAKKKDVPKLYKGLQKNSKNRPVFGVYAVPTLNTNEETTVGLGYQVHVE